jgi:hypothetical protein
LYNEAVRAFPGADVYVAATNDTKRRPFPFESKKELAELAGIPAGRFVQVKSPFRANEIVDHYDPNTTALIFVRSEKDRNEQPHAGGTKKDGSPAYLQPLAKRPKPMSQHGYMAYLPTIEFAGGITSASEIRGQWPTADTKTKSALVQTLYPRTKGNPKLVAHVVDLLNQALL